MRWVYDLVVLDRHGNFAKKVSESLLDGILNLLECLYVFQEGQQVTLTPWRKRKGYSTRAISESSFVTL